MVFDWFRRKFDQPPAQTAEDSAPKNLEVAPESSPEIPEDPAIPPEDEYLAWAKAAYQNLKQQQSQTLDTSPTPAVDPETIVAVEPISDVAESAKPVKPETIAADLESTPPDSPEVAVSDERSEISSAISTEDKIQVAVPSLLARAEADRQSRLDRLKAEAIVEPELTTSIPDPEPEKSNPLLLAFDEDFRWSAEVLAKEGRRPEEVSVEEITWLSRLRQGLDKTRRGVINQLKAAIGQGPLDGDGVLTLESLLIQADVGVLATDRIIDALQTKLRQESLPPDQAMEYLKQILRTMLDRPLADQSNPVLAPEPDRLNIWLVTGVNGAGKTTTIGKLAHLADKSGYRCLIAAADTFRAAAVQQVQVWGERTGVEVIANPGQNTDPAAVVYDALAAARSRQTELLLVDTAGRLQNKKNLMDELTKIRKTIDKNAKDARIESLLVLDSTLGQNGLRQAEIFAQAAGLSGVVLTKLDGTAKGGVALGVVEQLGLPIRFIGAGEKITDLRPFSSYEFVEALLNG